MTKTSPPLRALIGCFVGQPRNCCRQGEGSRISGFLASVLPDTLIPEGNCPMGVIGASVVWFSGFNTMLAEETIKLYLSKRLTVLNTFNCIGFLCD